MKIWITFCLFVFPTMLFAEEAEDSHQYEFYALCMDTHDEKQRSIDEQNQMLAELGFDGVAHLWLDKLEERVTSADQSGLHVVQVYLNVDLSQAVPFDPNLEKSLSCLKAKNSQLAILIYGGNPSEESLDDKAVEIIRKIVDIADKSDVKVVLYPHVGAWCESVADCVRIAKRFPDKKVGVMFNLCHWAAVDKTENLKSVLEMAIPWLAAVTINGTDTPEEIQARPGRDGWLQPLDSGSFDQNKVLVLLKELHYRGPIGLQCYGIPGDAKVHLERSMKKWRTLP